MSRRCTKCQCFMIKKPLPDNDEGFVCNNPKCPNCGLALTISSSIPIKGLKRGLYRQIKALSDLEDTTIGSLINEAMQLLLKARGIIA